MIVIIIIINIIIISPLSLEIEYDAVQGYTDSVLE